MAHENDNARVGKQGDINDARASRNTGGGRDPSAGSASHDLGLGVEGLDDAAQQSGSRTPTAGRDDEDVDAPTSDATAQADGDDGDPATGGIPTSTGERMGKGRTVKGPTGKGQVAEQHTAEGGVRSIKTGKPGPR